MSKLHCHVYGIPETEEGHSHPYAHILLPLTVNLTLRLNDDTHMVTPNHLVFIVPNCFHHCSSSKEIIMINIPESMIKDSDIQTLASQVCLPITGLLVPLVELIKEEVKRNPDSDSLRYLYYYLYGKLVECHDSKSLRYIQEHFGEEITVVELARIENYNPTYYTEWVRKRTGISPTQYIRQVRIQKAKELITATNYRMIDIALQVGYNNGAAFTKAFKEFEGITPMEYRRSVRASIIGSDTVNGDIPALQHNVIE